LELKNIIKELKMEEEVRYVLMREIVKYNRACDNAGFAVHRVRGDEKGPDLSFAVHRVRGDEKGPDLSGYSFLKIREPKREGGIKMEEWVPTERLEHYLNLENKK
jgi:hypothetical protein